ncbi:MAG TPA: Obg family GTPase CgtA [Patescibacteria group bacterium]|nr:Obg family GTPase CgtA [Patescibacteria group bacterium]
MLIDNVTITVKAGNGGNGASTFLHRAGMYKGGPDGGNGGNGGNVYIQGTSDLTALQQFQFKKKLKASDGIAGKRKNLYGRNAQDLIILVPMGTRVTDLSKEKTYEIEKEADKVLIAKGGTGGRGNREFASATNQVPRYAEKGGLGEEKEIQLELRLIADVGFIGLPNAGKSSLLAALTNAHPKIANYPFTTLEPNLGVMPSSKNIVLADIPGLIEGASSGKGLGFQFLKHIEKTKVLIHCIDATNEDLVSVYKTVINEFDKYSKELLNKPEVILLTKSDLLTKEEAEEKIEELKKLKKEIYLVSVYEEESVEKVKKVIEKLVII